jgi:hypothetical protein
VQGLAEYSSRAETSLQKVQGSNYYDLRKGLRFTEQIFEKPSDQGLVLLRAEVTRILRSLPGTRSVLQVTTTFERAARAATVNWKVRCGAGITEGITEIS